MKKVIMAGLVAGHLIYLGIVCELVSQRDRWEDRATRAAVVATRLWMEKNVYTFQKGATTD